MRGQEDRKVVQNVITALFLRASESARERFGNEHLPLIDRVLPARESIGPGMISSRYRPIHARDVDRAALDQFLDGLSLTSEWSDAISAIRDLTQSDQYNTILPGISVPLDGLLRLSVEVALSRATSWETPESESVELLSGMESSVAEFEALLILERIVLDTELSLGPAMNVRPIRTEELEELGRRSADAAHLVFGGGPEPPRHDWWVVGWRFAVERGADPWEAVWDLQNRLGLALRLFGAGAGTIRVGFVRPLSEYQRVGVTRELPSVVLSQSVTPYQLLGSARASWAEFFRKLSDIVGKPQHYLMVAARRLLRGGSRDMLEDSIVDYVVGLEGLLGKHDERTEIAFRFRTRGCVLLALDLEQRKDFRRKLRDLYGLRSSLVHGGSIQPNELIESAAFAEDALRRVWLWYFEHFRNAKNNDPGVEAIEDELVAPRGLDPMTPRISL